MEPVPASLLAFAEPTARSPEVSGDDLHAGGGGAPSASFVPRVRASAGFRELGEVLNDFGAASSLRVESVCRRGEGTLGARLFDAIDAVRWLMGDAETVHAAYEGAGMSARELSTDTLGGMHGTMSVNLLFGDGRMAHIFVSDSGASWSRMATLLGDGGRIESGSLRVGDGVFDWLGADGRVLDSSRPPRKRSAGKKGKAGSGAGGGSVHLPCAGVIGAQLRELLSGRAAPEPPIESARVLATAGAVLLSARTGQAESVATVLRMMGMGGG
jgi:predicted dehydrogenase